MKNIIVIGVPMYNYRNAHRLMTPFQCPFRRRQE